MNATNTPVILAEQKAALDMLNQGMSRKDIAIKLGISKDQVFRRIKAARKAERLDPALLQKLHSRGIVDLAGLDSGWLIDRDSDGIGHSLHFYLGRDEEKISFVDAITEALQEIPVAPLIKQPRQDREAIGNATWFFIADLHVGGDYGDDYLKRDYCAAIDDIVARLPPAEKAFMVELGDLLDANDHKGVTPASANPCDVKRDNHLQNTQQAVALMKYGIDRLAEKHQEVEVHLIKGNHDPTAYIAVMLSLEAHYANNPRIHVVVTEAEFRSVAWGTSAFFPSHGDKAKWQELKDVWSDQFADEWAAAKMYRLIPTAHFHHDRKRDLVGAVGEQFRTIHRPNNWAKELGLLSRGSLSAITVHKERGETDRTISNVTPIFMKNYKQK